MLFLAHIILYAMFQGNGSAECLTPVITQAHGVSTQSIAVSWLDVGNGPDAYYALEVVSSDSTPTGIPSVDSLTGSATTLSGLQPGTQYDIYLRALCTDGPSQWSGPVKATTFIDNDAACGIALAIPDNGCPQLTDYNIAVDGYSGLEMGTDIYLLSADIIIRHPWMADLSMYLKSPSGAEILLMQDRGVGVQNLGDPDDLTCTQVLRFTPAACTELAELHNGQTGDILPEESFESLYDMGSANGVWSLEICDKASDDVGTLLYAHLNFTENTCDFPPAMQLIQVRDTVAMLTGVADEMCDSVMIRYWQTDAAGDTVIAIFPCSGDTLVLDAVQPGNSYTYATSKYCDGMQSIEACPEEFNTVCNLISLWSDFESTSPCEPECDVSCTLSDTLWANTSDDDMDWTAYSGPTPTQLTGPNGTRFGPGTYLYTESTGDACEEGAVADLQSTCMRIKSDGTGCDLSFWYNMHGSSVGTLLVEISTDGGWNWDTLFSRSGDQGENWENAQIDLAAYDSTLARFRFRAIAGNGFLGDIAIDDIAFLGTTDGSGNAICYFRDADMDTFGNQDSSICICAMTPPPGYTIDSTDCDDTNPDISPAAPELPCNLIDDNCNGEIDEGFSFDPVDYVLLEMQNASCVGISNGVLGITGTGGTPPYTYAWNTGSDSSTITGLAPGTYQCTITDSIGCLGMTPEFNIQPIIHLEYYVVAASDPSCIGQHDGFISGVVQEGTPPYSFMWSNGDTTQDISGLGDGMYSVTVTDDQGCWYASEPVSLTASASFTAQVIQIKHVSCNGGTNGLIRIGPGPGAVPPVQYIWNTGDTTALISGLAVGDYSCTLTDSLGCMFFAGPYHLGEPSMLEAQVVSVVPPTCHDGNDGSIEISVNGGTPPYFYTWANGAFSEDLVNLEAGHYSVTISDLRGCDTMLQVDLVSPDSLQIQLDTLINVHCPADSSGSISVTATGGNPPYRYDWSTGSSDSATVTQLPPGKYSVTLSDTSGCKAILHNLEIDATNKPLTITFDSIHNVYCQGDSSGYVIVSVGGGTGPYWYNWSAGILHNSNDATDTLAMLTAGNYLVTVTDAIGCIGTSDTASIVQPMRLQFVLENIEHNTCPGDSLGVLDVSVSGGSPPYAYLWTTGDTTASLDALGAGMYQLSVTDSMGCVMQTPVFEITTPDSIIINFITVNETDHLANGSAEVKVTGGTPPYTYLWDTTAQSQTTVIASGLASGTYLVTITDDNDCLYVDSVFVDRTTAVVSVDNGSLLVYPNPADDVVIISSATPLSAVRCIGIDGIQRDAKLTGTGSRRCEVDVSDFPPGIYFFIFGETVCKVAVVH